MSCVIEQYRRALLDNVAHEARVRLCREIGAALAESGRRLWVFGLCHDLPARHAVSTITLMAGELASGAISLLEQKSWYSAASLVRQLIEVEYLMYLFAQEPDELARWQASSQADLRKVYRPAEMRRRSAGKFQDQEYWAHCAFGGHPNPIAEMLLPEHPRLWGTMRWAWVDLAQHLTRLWTSFVGAIDLHELWSVHAVAVANERVSPQIQDWREQDPCAAWLRPGFIEEMSKKNILALGKRPARPSEWLRSLADDDEVVG